MQKVLDKYFSLLAKVSCIIYSKPALRTPIVVAGARQAL